MSVKIFYNRLEETLVKKASEKLNLLLQNQRVLLLFSGGSALKILESINSSILSKKVTVSVLDERFSFDESENNFSQITKTSFYRNALENHCQFIDTRPNLNETMEELDKRFEDDLKKWKEKNVDGKIIATQGIGQDGHTSGIMPFPENTSLFHKLFEDERKWVIAYDAGDKNQFPLRITTTLPFLKMIDYSILYATGSSKKHVLQKALSPNTQLHEYPCRVIQKMKNVEIFTDQILE